MYELLKSLCFEHGVSGDEFGSFDAVSKILSCLGQVSISPVGSIVCQMPSSSQNVPHVMLTAHFDRIGLMVTRITDKGFLKVAQCGGVDRRALAGARVSVHTQTKVIKGIICSVPPHLSSGTQKCQTVEECAIDVGLTCEKAKAVIGYGDRITFDGELSKMIGDRVSGAALDNRAGCAAVIRAAQLLKDTSKAKITVVLSSQEENSSAGAKTSAYALSPDYAFVVDVSFASIPDSQADNCGKMCGGPMIGFAPILNTKLSKSMVEIAKMHNIPYQPEVVGKSTGTDADVIAVSKGGIKTALISVPQRFMHSPCEIVSLGDIENTAKLIALQIEEGLTC